MLLAIVIFQVLFNCLVLLLIQNVLEFEDAFEHMQKFLQHLVLEHLDVGVEVFGFFVLLLLFLFVLLVRYGLEASVADQCAVSEDNQIKPKLSLDVPFVEVFGVGE